MAINLREFGKLFAAGIGSTLSTFGACTATGPSARLDQAQPGIGPFDVERARRDTPGITRVTHLNTAGAALPPRGVRDAILDHVRLESEIGPYEAADAKAGLIKNTYQSLARLLGCAPDEIALSESGTRAWDMAFYAMRFNPGDRILTSAAEYGSNYIAYPQVAQRTGAVVEVLPERRARSGLAQRAPRGAATRPGRPRGAHACTRGGRARESGRGGRQAARLETRQRYMVEPTAQRFESWERNIGAQIGLGVAVEYTLAWDIGAIRERVTALSDRLRISLAELHGVAVHDLGRTRCGLVSFAMRGQEPAAVANALRARGINVGALGRRSTPLDMEDRGLDLVIRASVHYYNTDEEIDRLVDAVRDLAGRP